MNTLKGLLSGAGVGLVISLLVGLYNCGLETWALLTCSDDRPLAEMNQGAVISVIIAATLIGGLIGFFMDMSEHSYRKKEKKREKEKQRQMAEDARHNDLVCKFNHIIETVYTQSNVNNRLIFNNDNYRYAHDFLSSNANSPYFNELEDMYEFYKEQHISFISAELNKLKIEKETRMNGLNALIMIGNHLRHYSNMSNNQMNDLANQVQNIPRYIKNKSFFLEENNYGKINQELYEKSIDNSTVIDGVYRKTVKTYEDITLFRSLSELNNFNVNFINLIISTLYKCAFLKPFDATKYQKIYYIWESLNFTLYKDTRTSKEDKFIIPPIDCIFSKIIAYSRMGKGVLNQIKPDIDLWVNACLSGQNGSNSNDLVTLSSGLMWLGEYGLELELLRKAASAGVQLKPEIQERLAFLENGGSVGPELYNDINTDVFNYDYSSLKWSDNDFSTFFKNLIFKNEVLTYALVVEEFKKSFKAKFKTPVTYEMMLKELNKMAEDEYLGEITCNFIKVNSLSEQFNEYDDAIIINLNQSTGIKHAAILLFYNKIGVNINIQILTVFIPVKSVDGQMNMKLAVALKQQTSPKVIQTLESIRDSVARQIDELCENNQPLENNIY